MVNRNRNSIIVIVKSNPNSEFQNSEFQAQDPAEAGVPAILSVQRSNVALQI